MKISGKMLIMTNVEIRHVMEENPAIHEITIGNIDHRDIEELETNFMRKKVEIIIVDAKEDGK